MKHMYTWCAILVVAFASVVGDVLLARAMKQVGDVHALWRRAGVWTVVSRILGNSNFFLGVTAMARLTPLTIVETGLPSFSNCSAQYCTLIPALLQMYS